ncbi:hypothetical protein ZWY2020_041627 [Hordeum vulgare]|nr:hypothetical protein ZWY2020_041627 [Hordeum vulgare]
MSRVRDRTEDFKESVRVAALSHGYTEPRALRLGLLRPCVFTSGSLVHAYLRFGRVSEAYRLFDEMPERNLPAWNAMLSGLCRNAHVSETEKGSSGRFTKIMEKKLGDNPLGPILSADKKLVDAKLAEEADEHKSKGEARKEKCIAARKGHKIHENAIDNKEKMLIKVATQVVVRLFNEVSKRQTRKGLNPSRSKDVKCMTFSFSMLFTSFNV